MGVNGIKENLTRAQFSNLVFFNVLNTCIDYSLNKLMAWMPEWSKLNILFATQDGCGVAGCVDPEGSSGTRR